MLEVEIRDRIGDLSLEATFEAAPGEIVAITGPSGSGKTTLLRAVAGLRKPLSGRISLDGEAWLDSISGTFVPCELRRVGMVFQEYALFPRMRARANVEFALAGLPRDDRRREAERVLDRVGLSAVLDHRPGQLSGGERQRLALARAIATKPSILLLDEPLASLDPDTAAAAADLIEDTVAELQVPCLLVTHDGGTAANASAVLRLERGRPARLQ